MRYVRLSSGFTIVEVLTIVVLVGILVAGSVVVYGGIQHRASDNHAQSTVSDALKSLQVYHSMHRSYPSNIADTEYAPPMSVAVAFYTNAIQAPKYPNLTSDQNAQLFLNVCNGLMPIKSSTGTVYNTSCSFAGNNVHVAGQNSSNIVIHGPTVDEGDFDLTCGPECESVQAEIIQVFKAQLGTFPVKVPKKSVPLPEPQSVSQGAATRFCLEARSPQFDSVIYHATSETQNLTPGPCPADPALHYP